MASQGEGARDRSVSPSTSRSESPSTDSQVTISEPDRLRDPKTKITWFAVKLAILEKLASSFGYLVFMWATVVLLGGSASSLETTDFWVVTAILSMEGTRIFIRSLKWHHEIMLIFMATIIDEAKWLRNKLFRSMGSNNRNENVESLKKSLMSFFILILLLAQLLSALAYISLSIYRLVKLDHSGDSNRQIRNLEPALKIFYGLCLGEAFVIFLEMAYGLWNICVRKLLKEVNDDYDFRGEAGLYTVESFLYATYSRCVDGSVFDGLKMEFVTYSMELPRSENVNGQRAGAQVLSMLASNDNFAEKTLRAIGTKRDVVERLVDMLNFKNEHEQEIRKAAAQIISKLVENNPDTSNRDCIRVTAIDGFMESIASLLYSEDPSQQGFVFLGLTILQNLACERSNHDKIACSRGLLPKIIALVDVEPLEIRKLSLQIVKTLASTTGSRGKALRKQIREIVFSISNLRKVLHYQEESKHSLQILAIETLTSLASEKEGRERIGGTGGVLNQLFSLFFTERDNLSLMEMVIPSPVWMIGHFFVSNGDMSERKKLVEKAIEALGFLSLESEHNCEIMMKLDGHPTLIANLISLLNGTAEDHPVLFIHVARILRNLLVHAKAADVNSSEISAMVPKFVVTKFSCQSLQSAEHSCYPLEAAIGLAAQFFSFMNKWNLVVEFEESSGISTESLISKVVDVIKSHPYPLKQVPNIRRFSLELLNAVMLNAVIFSLEIRPVMEKKRSELVDALKGVMNTTSDWEYYNAFSGSMGLSRHGTSIRYLAEYAMESFPAS